MTVKMLEIVHVRSGSDYAAELATAIRSSAANETPGIRIEVYTRQDVTSDVSVHIIRDGDSSGAAKSVIGLRLASELKRHGMVQHTVWAKQLGD